MLTLPKNTMVEPYPKNMVTTMVLFGRENLNTFENVHLKCFPGPLSYF